MFTQRVDVQAGHRLVMCEFPPPMLKQGPKRYRMPLHFGDDANAMEALSKQLASLPLEVESRDYAHKQANVHEPAFNVDGGPWTIHSLHSSSADSVCPDGHRLLHDMGYCPITQRSAYSMLVALYEFEARQRKQELVMGYISRGCLSRRRRRGHLIR